MYKNVYGDKRVLIVCGKYEGLGKKCADYIYGELAHEFPYILTICEADSLTDEQKKYYNIIAIGTKENNSYIAELCKNNIVSVPDHKDGYRIKVCDNPANPENQIVVLAGGGDTGAFYAASHFSNKYLTEHSDRNFDYLPENEGLSSQGFLFATKIAEVDFEEVPKINERGIWTWGHVIYDYKSFLDNMALLRLNIITVWNDFVPINVKEFTDYAHELGIKVIWGFSIGWGYEYDISKDSVLDEIIENAVENYRNNYTNLNSDGIYFQCFTETKEADKNGVNIAERVKTFVNKINKRFREEFGDIRLQFGLHASSIKNNLDQIAQISPEVEITYEDCGSFPYEYLPERLAGFEETKALTEKITVLRGKDEKFSAVLKGLSTLPWRTFEHQMDTFDMGVWSKRYIAKKYDSKKKFWRRRNTMWIKNGEYAREMVEIIRTKTNGATAIQFLMEDGMLEEKICLSFAITAELMWNSDRKFTDIVCEAGMMDDVDF